MQQALAFATSAGLGFWIFRSQLQGTFPNGAGTDLMGIDTQNLREVSINQPSFTPSLYNGQPGPAINHRADNTAETRGRQQDLINTSKFESRHFILDSLRFLGDGQTAKINDGTLPTAYSWTKAGDPIDT